MLYGLNTAQLGAYDFAAIRFDGLYKLETNTHVSQYLLTTNLTQENEEDNRSYFPCKLRMNMSMRSFNFSQHPDSIPKFRGYGIKLSSDTRAQES